MTLEEKLSNFKECAINDANMQSHALISDSEENIKNGLYEYDAKAKAEYENRLRIESNIIVNKNNQDITRDTLVIKQQVEKRRLELVNKLFDELEDRLKAFKQTEEYIDLLIKQIEKVKEFANDSDFVVFIDKSDKHLLEQLKNSTSASIEISNTSIKGGIKAIIKEKNLMLNYTFVDRLNEERANFSF